MNFAATDAATVDGEGPAVVHLRSLLGADVVLIWLPAGEKNPGWSGWQKTTVERMCDPRYIKRLNSADNLAVLTGEPSGGLCSIDIDDDSAVGPFLELNPKLAGTLMSRGGRGCNLWVRVRGPIPRYMPLNTTEGRAWGEWRSTGAATMIHGTHPNGMTYRRDPEVPPVTMSFADIVWPANLQLPWLSEGQGEETSDEEIDREFGGPFLWGMGKDKEYYIKGISEPYWAALYAKEHMMLHEPDERRFYLYDRGTGIFDEESADRIKQGISSRLLGVARDGSGDARLLESMRTDRTLNAVVSQLRGISEERGAFTNRPGVVHLANGVLRLGESGFELLSFSPEFRSRNRSPIAFDPKATCPRFLNELLAPAVHPEDITLLQKMAGQCLLGRNPVQRFLILDGKAGRGKSQYASVLQGIVGQQNVTELRTRHLGERFELFRMLRRTLLVGVDVGSDFLSMAGAQVIKGLVGGDWFDAEQKGGTGSFPVQGNFNILMTSNSRLKVRLQGDVGAWKRRMLIVRYEAPKPKKKIPEFGELLVKEEGSGILNWALQGLLALQEDIDATGQIRLTPRQESIVDSLLAESDSLRHFLRDCVVSAPGDTLTVAEITRAYAHYCPDKGWDPMKDTDIGSQLPSLMLELFRTAKAHDIKRDGRSHRGFRDVAFTGPQA